MSAPLRLVQRMLVLVGNTLTGIGCFSLAMGAIGVIDPEHFSIGISSGLRVIGSVAIAGCLFSAIGYGVSEFQERYKTKG